MSKRESNYDILRIIATLAVVLIHVNYHFLESILYQRDMSLAWVAMSLINIVTRFSVPCFVMLSGAFQLSNEKNSDIAYFYKKTLVKVIIPALFIIILSIPVYIFMNKDNPNVLFDIAERLIAGDYYSFWYIYMLAGLYLMTPFLIRIKRSITHRQYVLISVVLLLWAIVSQAFSKQTMSSSIGVVFAFLGYYILGDVIRQHTFKPSVRTLSFVLGCLSVLLTFVFRYMGIDMYLFHPFVAFLSPGIVVFSICVFIFFSSISIKGDYSEISGITFEIYLLHSIILSVITSYGLEKTMQRKFSLIVLFVVVVLLSGILGWLFSRLMKKANPSIARVVNNLSFWKLISR